LKILPSHAVDSPIRVDELQAFKPVDDSSNVLSANPRYDPEQTLIEIYLFPKPIPHFGVTIDFQSLEDNMATIRERDSMNQIRVPIDVLKGTLQAKLAGEDLFVLPEGGKIWKEEKK
jgi:hypothetical protein